MLENLLFGLVEVLPYRPILSINEDNRPNCMPLTLKNKFFHRIFEIGSGFKSKALKASLFLLSCVTLKGKTLLIDEIFQKKLTAIKIIKLLKFLKNSFQRPRSHPQRGLS